MLNIAGTFTFVLLFIGCSHSSLSNLDPLEQQALKLVPIDDNAPVTFQLNHKSGRVEITDHYANTHTVFYENNEKVRENNRVLKFRTENKILNFYNKSEIIGTEIKTLTKSGFGDLNDLGFPRMNQTISMSLKLDSRVQKAGDFPLESVFYVRSVPLPPTPKAIGDSWTFKERWLSTPKLLPIELKLNINFKALYKCGTNDRCADLEIAGETKILLDNKTSRSHKGVLRGRMLFAIEAGVVVWSMIKTRDNLEMEKESLLITSCLASRLRQPSNEIWGKMDQAAHCVP